MSAGVGGGGGVHWIGSVVVSWCDQLPFRILSSRLVYWYRSTSPLFHQTLTCPSNPIQPSGRHCCTLNAPILEQMFLASKLSYICSVRTVVPIALALHHDALGGMVTTTPYIIVRSLKRANHSTC